MRDKTSLPMLQPRQPTVSLPSSFDADERLRWVERIARLMDSQFRLPGTGFRFGLDPLLGLVPVVGDLSIAVRCRWPCS